MYGITNKPVTLVTQQVTSEGDVERATTAKKDISSTSSSDGNAAQKIVQEKLVTRAEKSVMTSESWKPTLRSPESVTLRSSCKLNRSQVRPIVRCLEGAHNHRPIPSPLFWPR